MILRRRLSARQLLPRDLYFWLKGLLLALVAIQLARLVWALVTPIGPVGRWLPPAPPAIPAATQLALLSTFNPFAAGAPTGGAAQPAASLTGFTLFGTRMAAGAGGGSAIIAGADGIQQSFAVGDEVGPGVRLLSVGFDFVMVGSNENKQRLAMEGAEPEAAPAAAAPSATGSARLTVAAIRENIAFAPRMANGQVTGLLVSPLGDPALLAAAGLRDGDVITAVNGRPLTNPAALQSQLAPGARLSLTVERGAAAVPVALLLEGNP